MVHNRYLTKLPQRRRLACFMVDEVGLARVSIPYCKKKLLFLRRLSKEAVRKNLHRLGLAWRARRGKAVILRREVQMVGAGVVGGKEGRGRKGGEGERDGWDGGRDGGKG